MTEGVFITLAVVGFVVVTLMFTRIGPDLVLLCGLALLMLARVLSPHDAMVGFSNEGMLTVGALFAVVAGLRETGAMQLVMHRLFGKVDSVFKAQLRLLIPVAAMSGFLNNTPVVAMMLPVVDDWARKFRIPASKLLIPLSYAAILGGSCTLIGTSTNLVISGLLADAGYGQLGMFDISKLGVPCLVVGLIYILLCSRWLLPDRTKLRGGIQDPREYTVEMIVESDSPIDGKSIEDAGLRRLPGMYLVEIGRGTEVLTAVSPKATLRGGDRLVFVGIVDSALELQKMRGLRPATDQLFKLDAPRSRRCLVEVVVSDTCPILGRSISRSNFRQLYNAVIIAVSRNGERVNRKIGDIVPRAGDTLLLETKLSFFEQQRSSRDFYLVSRLDDSTPRRFERGWVALLILAAMVGVAASGLLPMLLAAIIAAGLMIATRCCTGAAARRSIDLQVLLAIASAIGIGSAMKLSGAAAWVSDLAIGLAGENPTVNLAAIYLVTVLFTELITHIGAAVLLFPIAMATAHQLGVSHVPFVMTLMFAASASFMTPIGYQTNLMVYGPGGYRFTDFVRFGAPLSLLMGVICVWLVPHLWPF